MFDFYRDYKLQYIAGDYVLISDWYGKDNSLCCANLQDAKNQIDKRIKDYIKDYTVADTPPDCMGLYPATVTNQKEEGINPMFDDNDCCVSTAPMPRLKARTTIANAQIIGNVPVEATQRDYAIERIKAIGEKHAAALRVQFRMDGQRPRTALELIDFIKNGKYTLDDAMVNSEDAIHFFNEYGINWGEKPDRVGYAAAKEVLKTAAQKALDAATLKTLDALEGVIDDFEAWTYVPKS